MKNKKINKEKKISLSFATILAIVSIIGFFDIMNSSFFDFSIGGYQDVLWLIILGIGFILESKPKSFSKKKKETPVTNLSSLVIGFIAIIAGILSMPFIGIDHPVFLAVKGVISVIAIIFIIFQTWVVKEQ